MPKKKVSKKENKISERELQRLRKQFKEAEERHKKALRMLQTETDPAKIHALIIVKGKAFDDMMIAAAKMKK